VRENVVVETRTCQVPDVITTSRTHGWPKDPGWAVPDAATTYATRSAASTGSWSSPRGAWTGHSRQSGGPSARSFR